MKKRKADESPVFWDVPEGQQGMFKRAAKLKVERPKARAKRRSK